MVSKVVRNKDGSMMPRDPRGWREKSPPKRKHLSWILTGNKELLGEGMVSKICSG